MSALSINPLLVAIANGFTIGVKEYTHFHIVRCKLYRNENRISVITQIKYTYAYDSNKMIFFFFLSFAYIHTRSLAPTHTHIGGANKKETNLFAAFLLDEKGSNECN